MGLKYRTYLDGTLVYGCSKCKTHLTTGDAIISKVRSMQSMTLSIYIYDFFFALGLSWSTWPSLSIQLCVSSFSPQSIRFLGPFNVSETSVNVVEGITEDRAMTTGLHTVKDISCVKCNTVLGWTYVGFLFLSLLRLLPAKSNSILFLYRSRHTARTTSTRKANSF